MAARLVQRCCRPLFGASTSLPLASPASLLAPASRTVQARALPQAALASLHTSNLSRQTDKLLFKEKVYSKHTEHSEIDELIESASSPEELLHVGEQHSLSGHQAATLIIQLSRLVMEKKLETESIVQDSRFQQVLNVLNSQALELAEHFSIEDIRKVALALAVQNRRSVPLLRAISYHLVQKHFALSTSVLVDLAFAYGKLNFHQTQVFQKMASDLQPHVPQMTHGDVGRCVKSFAYLKWLNLPLFEAFAQYALDNADRFTVAQLCNIVLSFARLNFQPSQGETFYSTVHEKLANRLDSLDPHGLMDLVWSLCVLQQAKAPYLQSVLAPQLYDPLLDDQSPRGQNYRLKLLHVNAAARLECPGYPGPFLPPEALHATEPPGDRKATPLQSSLQEALKGVAGDEGNRRVNVQTIYGWQLDAEMVLNSEGQPLPIKDFTAPHLLQCEGTKPLPQGTRRIAFLRWEFPNFSSRSKDLLGRFAMARRHVQAAGFLVVDVPYYEFLELKSEWQKAAYLRDRMNKAVGEDMVK
nr:FAST kinase domain-containing protein 4 isoform X2 [Pelodiscus sinensis]|eukprot:XP_025043794.1 FAST kinase domain-containing protein 4 isoform X2 [Pelodiscus sinensis]